MCTPQNATPVEELIESDSGGSGADILTKAHDLIGGGTKRSPKPDSQLEALIVRAVLSPRATFVKCTATEMCFSLAGAPFCYDVATGDFHDGAGTTGNAISGDYTLADGRMGNLYTGPYPTPTTTGEVIATTNAVMSTAATETGLGTSQGPAQTMSSSSSPTGQTASATQNGAMKAGVQAMLGRLLVVEGVALLYGGF